MPTCCLRALGVLDAGEADRDLVAAEPLDLGLGDAERVDALAHDVDRAVDRLGRDLALRRGLALVDELDAALEVEAEARLLGRDHDHRRGQEAEHQQDHEEVASAGGHRVRDLAVPAAILDAVACRRSAHRR